MADLTATSAQHSAVRDPLPPRSVPHADPPEPPDAIAITRAFQSAVLRLRWTLAAMKFAADGEHENPQQPPLFWPDLIDALAILTPDADLLDEVVDELRLARLRGDASHGIAS